ncbi:MAG TPA: hypothetical protein EYP04_06215 [Anaerolineae bacterium]|nr:hypothetical protein [Anaerolineae bacterium]
MTQPRDLVRETEGRLICLNLEDGFWIAWRQRGGWWPADEKRLRPEPAPAFEQPLTVSLPAFEGEASEYPLYLYPYPSIALSDGRGANQPWLQETPDPVTTVSWNTWVELNPGTTAQLGLEDNDVVKVISPYDEIEAVVYTHPGIRPDVAAVPVGQGHERYGRYAQNRGANPVRLLAPAVDEDIGALA